MPLSYYPRPGEILLCNYDTGFVPPEMVKRRPVAVISPRRRRGGQLVTVVPFSTTAPVPIEDYHCSIRLMVPLPPPFDAPAMWAKCDMIATISLARLDRFRSRRPGAGRSFVSGQLEPAQLHAVRGSVLRALGWLH